MKLRTSVMVPVLWIAAATPAVVQLGLLVYTMLARLPYPYDLEWMEGGLLTHAHRISSGVGIYVEPSVDFVPYLYTPLYPALVAVFGKIFGISYALGRAISVCATLAIVGISMVEIVRQSDETTRWPARCGAACAVGLWAACYPYMEGWYDLVRADTLFLAMTLGGLHGIRAFARAPGRRGLGKLASVSALLALSFFCKQTGILFVAIGGAVLLVLNWRRVPLYVAVTGTIGLGGTALLNKATDGWFWTYIYEVHQAHDFNMTRVWDSFGNILLQFPALTVVVVIGVGVVVLTAIIKRKRGPGSEAFMMWAPIFAASTVIGAISWGTQWAHFNAYMPAFATGAIAAGAAIPAVVGSLSLWVRDRENAPTVAGLGIAVLLAFQLGATMWRPSTFVPTAADRKAGDNLIETLKAIDGELYVPYHPWYAHLAGKRMFVHRMGLDDMTYNNRWRVRGADEALLSQRFSAVVLDSRPLGRAFSLLKRGYKCQLALPTTSQPHVYTGAGARYTAANRLVPQHLWVPNRPDPVPPGATVLFDFEAGDLSDWIHTGSAWGRPISGPLPRQGLVCGVGGQRYLSSYHGGDAATGQLESPPFAILGRRLTLKIGGGNAAESLRAELRVDGKVVGTATGDNREQLREVTWDVSAHVGKQATLALIDDNKGSWGHLNIDDVLQWAE